MCQLFQNGLRQIQRAFEKVKENAYVDWFVYEVEGSQILMRILNNRETYMIGWMDISQIFQEFEKTLSDVKEEKYF